MGVDVGGTRIRASAVTADGQFLSQTESRTTARRGPAAVLEAIQLTIREAARPLPFIAAIGVACAGQIDPRSGAVVYAPNLGWRDVPLAAQLAAAFQVPVAVENDVRAAAWGEFKFGAGRGVDSLLAVFVGTGVGSGAVLNGALWRGAGNAAGEIGHTQVVIDGRPCPCGQRGCLEQYISGSGFQRQLADALSQGIATRLSPLTEGDPSRLTAAMVWDAARSGDAFAAEVWSSATRYLTMGVANAVTLLNPQTVVLGGGVVEAVPTLFDEVTTGVMSLTTILARASLRIDRPRLGDWSGVAGAAALAAR